MDHANHHNHAVGHSDHDKHAGHDPVMFRQKFWISLLLTVPTLIFSHTIQTWLGFELSFAGSEYIPAIFGVGIFVYGGLVFLKSAWHEILAKRPGMMTLISMAISVALVYSLAVTLGVVDGMDFWWELATLVTIMLFGHWLEMASVAKASGALNELAKLLPDEAELVVSEGYKIVPVGELAQGDQVLVRPGSKIPIDGVVKKGESKVNESMLTGESKLVQKNISSAVFGGTLNTDGALTVEVTKTGDDTALSGIMRLVEEAQASKSKTQVLADKAAYYLTFIALGAALLTWLGWWAAGASAGFILERVVTVLVIACPHALGLAIPLVTAISTTRAAQSGLLVRERLVLEAARNIDVVLFDKTGTLTKGELGVVDVVSSDPRRLLSVAAATEHASEHPIATAIVDYANNKEHVSVEASRFLNIAGRGVQATVNNELVHVGGPQMLDWLDLSLDDDLRLSTNQAADDGKSIIYVIKNKEILGAVLLADVIRDESREAVASLRSMGKRVAMITGDSQGVARWVAAELGIEEYFAEVLPENKSDIVKELQKNGSIVAMVGDGVNDAPALAQADVGIAIGVGTDVAIESAGVILMSSDPRGVAKVVSLSRVTYRKMIQNLIWATGYNALAIPLAAGLASGVGFVLSPAVGAVLMSVSTIIVAINAQLLRRVKLDK